MSSPQNLNRFRANPVEVAIFLAATLILANSVYELFYSPNEFHPHALSPMHANPISEGRSPSSTTFLNQTLSIDCKKLATGASEELTSASKIRLVGALCGLQEPAIEAERRPRILVTNLANQFSATVFADQSSDKFSTDYIPLNAGKNTLHLEFSYNQGQTVSLEININKIGS